MFEAVLNPHPQLHIEYVFVWQSSQRVLSLDFLFLEIGEGSFELNLNNLQNVIFNFCDAVMEAILNLIGELF